MKRRLESTVVLAALLGLLTCWASQSLLAQEPDPAADDGEQAEKTLHEQSIYIPYEKLREVFEKHGRGVFLPYEKFQELWQAARDKGQPTTELKPPVGALITETENEATVAKDVVRVEALVKIEILTEGWHEVSLRLADAAITRATLGDQPARILGGAGADYRILLEKKGKQPEQFELTLEYAKAITRTPGQNSVSFQAPQAPVSRWRVRIPQSGVKVNVHPLIAATEVPPKEGESPEESPEEVPRPKIEETVVLAFVGAAPQVRIDWTPKAEGATGLTALASVDSQQQIWVNEGVVRTRTRLAYTISRAELPQLSIEVPADQKVVAVADPNVRQWTVEKVDEKQRITAQLFDPAEKSQQVTVELEKFLPDQDKSEVAVPVVRALDVGRQQGVVVVHVAEGLRAEATETAGLLQLDAAELPKDLAEGKWTFAYRYATIPFALQLGVEKVQPRIAVDSLIEAHLQPQRLSIDMLAVYTIERAGVFRLELDVPTGYEIRRVEGRKAAGAEAVVVDSHHLEGDDQTRLVVNLARKAIGRVALVVNLQKDLQQPDLMTPTGNKVEIPLQIPRIAPGTVQQDSGRLIVFAPESLEVGQSTSEGLQEVSLQEAMQGMEPVRQKKPPGVRSVLERTFGREAISLSLSAKRRKPQVTIRQLLVARIDNGMVKYEATFFYKILYSGVKSLRIDLPVVDDEGPNAATRQWRNLSEGINDEVIEPPEDAKPEAGYEAWNFTGKAELIGDGQIKLVRQEPIANLAVGEPVTLSVPYLKPIGADRVWGQIVLAKAETIDVREKDKSPGLRGIDPQHDLTTPVADAARAFEFHDDWKLSVVATQYKLEELKRTVIEQAVVRMVLTRAEKIPVQAVYRMRSARQRLEVKLPDGATFDTDPARINGRPVTLQSQKESYFVPLLDSSDETPFLLELRYTVSGAGSRLDLPTFPEEAAVQKLYLGVYIPREWDLMGFRGPWNEEHRWVLDDSLNWEPVFRPDITSLIGQMHESIEMTAGTGGTFQTDGRLYVFSTLCPKPPPEGALYLTTIDQTLLHGIVLLIVIFAGLLLIRRSVSTKVLAVGSLIVALVLCGVFLPTFSLQILDGVLASAIFIVVVMWVMWYAARVRPMIVARMKTEAPVAKPAAPDQPTPPSDASSSDKGASNKGDKADA